MPTTANQLPKGPIAAVVVVLLLMAGFVMLTSSDDESSSDTAAADLIQTTTTGAVLPPTSTEPPAAAAVICLQTTGPKAAQMRTDAIAVMETTMADWKDEKDEGKRLPLLLAVLPMTKESLPEGALWSVALPGSVAMPSEEGATDPDTGLTPMDVAIQQRNDLGAAIDASLPALKAIKVEGTGTTEADITGCGVAALQQFQSVGLGAGDKRVLLSITSGDAGNLKQGFEFVDVGSLNGVDFGAALAPTGRTEEAGARVSVTYYAQLAGAVDCKPEEEMGKKCTAEPDYFKSPLIPEARGWISQKLRDS
jgi:hypothetical protein